VLHQQLQHGLGDSAEKVPVILLLQTLWTLSDDQTEYQLRDRLSFMRFVGLSLADPVPDAKTIWLFREQLVRAGVRAAVRAVRRGAARATLLCLSAPFPNCMAPGAAMREGVTWCSSGTGSDEPSGINAAPNCPGILAA
jgi:Transposase domain (DUF772)